MLALSLLRVGIEGTECLTWFISLTTAILMRVRQSLNAAFKVLLVPCGTGHFSQLLFLVHLWGTVRLISPGTDLVISFLVKLLVFFVYSSY